MANGERFLHLTEVNAEPSGSHETVFTSFGGVSEPLSAREITFHRMSLAVQTVLGCDDTRRALSCAVAC